MTYEELLESMVGIDKRIFVMTAENRAAIRNLPGKIGGNFIDTGITESTLVGMAAGLALRGNIPVAHALATFLTLRAFEFIRDDVGIPNLPVKLVGAVPGFLSDGNGPTHQAIEDISLMRGIPNMKVFTPADEQELLLGLPHIIHSPAPWYIRYNAMKPIYDHNNTFEIGKAEVVAEGKDITLLVYGFMFSETLKAKSILESKGLSVGLLNIRTPKPIDKDAVLFSALSSKLLVTIEDHFLTGGLFSIVAELLTLNRVAANVLPIALEERWFKPATLPAVLEYEGFTAEAIAEKVFNKFQSLN